MDRSDADAPLDATERIGSIIKEGLDVWEAQARRWSDRTTERATWSPEDVVGDCTNLIENLTPLLERSIDLTIEFLRPWAKAFEAQR